VVFRLIGIRWVANLLYPNLFHDDMRAVTRQFYAEFYHWQLSDAELDHILASATPRTP
jgi:iron complex transport system substrate-binding protein